MDGFPLPGPVHVTVAVSSEICPIRAVEELAPQFDPRETCFVMVFVPAHLEPARLCAALEARMGGVPVFGCTTAGTITPRGYQTDVLMMIGFPKRHFRCASLLITPLNPLSITGTVSELRRHAARFQRTAGWNRLALVLADGVSKQEDMLVSTLEAGLGEVPVFGGSAGDGLAFEATHVLHHGECHRDAALLLLLETDLEFRGLGFDHFLPTDCQMIVTDARPEARLVSEINGAPAAREYARLIGCSVDALSPRIFAENPTLVRQNLNYHVRAIHAVHGDSLSFLGAIEDGLILTLGRGKEIIRTLETGLDIRSSHGRRPDFILGFDCVLRKLEIEQKQLGPQVSRILSRHNVLGFNTYGEQHCGVHVNQTFVGVAFFDPVQERLH